MSGSHVTQYLTFGNCTPNRAAAKITFTNTLANKVKPKSCRAQIDRGFGLLEWAGKLVPQGVVVTGALLDT